MVRAGSLLREISMVFKVGKRLDERRSMYIELYCFDKCRANEAIRLGFQSASEEEKYFGLIIIIFFLFIYLRIFRIGPIL